MVRDSEIITSGIKGLDDILKGGLPECCLYMISGTPGSGKTTLAIQFLLEGVKNGESCLYITLSESRNEINKVAKSHDWDLSKINICELIPSEINLGADAQLTVFNPSELELGETTEAMMREVEKYKPKRIVLDSLSELRLVAQNPLRYRRQILGLKQFFSGLDCTILMLDDLSAGSSEGQLESIAHGVISLEQLATEYGSERRRLRVVKMRGVHYRGGFHDFLIRKGGLDIFPRLIAAEHFSDFPRDIYSSGNEELDTLLGGGVPAGTSTLLLGPAGTGKSTIATQFASAAANRGERAAMFLFDENLGTLKSRSGQLGIKLEPFIESSLLTIKQIDPAELSPGEFMSVIRKAVDGIDGQLPAKVVVIDSLNGYLNAMPEEKFLTAQLHELLAYLGQKGVVTIICVTQSGMFTGMQSPVDTTYLADNVVLFRYFEARGEVRKAVSVIKKRSGKHELTIRELTVDETGVNVGKPLKDFEGVLTGVPTYVGENDSLTKAQDAH